VFAVTRVRVNVASAVVEIPPPSPAVLLETALSVNDNDPLL
jgi:hypothetical protein